MDVPVNSTSYNNKIACLCCLKNEHVLHSVYKSNLKDLYISLTHLEISEHDGYPSNICLRCMLILKICSSFVEQCRTSYKTLTETQIKEELDSNFIGRDDDVVLDNSSEVKFFHLPNYKNDDFENATYEKNENSYSGIEDTPFAIPSTMTLLHLNHDDNFLKQEQVEDATNNAKILRVALTRMPHVSDDSSTNSTSDTAIHSEENSREPMSLDATENASDSSASGSVVSDSSSDLKSKKYKCTICRFRGRSNYALTKHQKSHASKEAESIQCDVLKTEINNKKVFTCSVCDYTNPYMSVLRIHIRKHTQERPFKCDFCPHTSKTSRSLKLHKMTHTKDGPYKCCVCPFTTRSSTQLKAHEMIHPGERQFMCDICPYASLRSDYLKLHKMIHTEERAFNCDS